MSVDEHTQVGNDMVSVDEHTQVGNDMVSVDEHTQVGIEIVSEGSKLTGEIILKILQSVNDLLQRENEKQDFILKDNTKEGKQSIKDLVKKHSDGVMSFDDNLTKEQVGDYQKTF
ncbi:MAG: hypothetical protein ACQEW5_24835 [Bacillota bacterium]